MRCVAKLRRSPLESLSKGSRLVKHACWVEHMSCTYSERGFCTWSAAQSLHRSRKRLYSNFEKATAVAENGNGSVQCVVRDCRTVVCRATCTCLIRIHKLLCNASKSILRIVTILIRRKWCPWCVAIDFPSNSTPLTLTKGSSSCATSRPSDSCVTTCANVASLISTEPK